MALFNQRSPGGTARSVCIGWRQAGPQTPRTYATQDFNQEPYLEINWQTVQVPKQKPHAECPSMLVMLLSAPAEVLKWPSRTAPHRVQDLLIQERAQLAHQTCCTQAFLATAATCSLSRNTPKVAHRYSVGRCNPIQG